MVAEYKPDYIKLEAKNPIKDVDSPFATDILAENNFPFGSFSRLIPNNRDKRWNVLRFDPYSKDLNSGDLYKTRNAALKVALTHLDKQGFYAIPFDLEALIDKVEIPK